MVKKIIVKLIGKPIIILLAFSILVMMVAQLIFSNQLATSTVKLSQIIAEIENFERQNRDLTVAIHQKGAILQLKKLAKEAGFIEPKKFFFVRQNFLLAQEFPTD